MSTTAVIVLSNIGIKQLVISFVDYCQTHNSSNMLLDIAITVTTIGTFSFADMVGNTWTFSFLYSGKVHNSSPQ